MAPVSPTETIRREILPRPDRNSLDAGDPPVARDKEKRDVRATRSFATEVCERKTRDGEMVFQRIRELMTHIALRGMAVGAFY
jgi:hypothetical protein